MSKSKKNSTTIPKMNKQEMRRAEQERQKKQSRILITVTAVVVAIIFTALFFLAYKDSGANESSGSNVEFNYSELQRLGKEDAPVKIVEFGDFKCPACAQFTGAIKPQIVQDYVDQGKAAFYFVNMTFIGPDSETASLAALSVYHQNNEEFWKYYDALYANQGKEEEEWATVDFLVDLAQQEKLAIDYDLLRKDIQEQTYADELKRHNDLATETNVSSTPTVYVNGSKIADPFNYEAITQEIEKAAEAVSVQ